MMHILGHIVGFGHAVTDEYAMPSDNYIIGTAVSDKKSIMRAENDILYTSEKWTGFSESDIKTVQYLYPPKEKPRFTLDCEPAGTGTDSSTLTLGTTYTFTAKYVFSQCPDPKYQITIKKTSLGASEYELHETANGTYTIAFTEAGSYKVSVKVTNASRNNLIEKTYYVPTPKPAVTDITCSPASTGDNNQLVLGKAYVFTASCIDATCPNPEFSMSVVKNDMDVSIFEMENIENGKISVVFYAPGRYEISAEVTNSKTPIHFEKVFYLPAIDPPKTSIACYCNGTKINENTLFLDTAYQFTADCIYPLCIDPLYDIKIKKKDTGATGYKSENIKNGRISVQFDQPGEYGIMVEVTNSPVPIRFEKTFVLSAPESRIIAPDDIELGKVYEFEIKDKSTAIPTIAPTYTIQIKETLFQDPKYTIIDQTRNRFSIRFDEPGDYVLEFYDDQSSMSPVESYYVSVYWQPKCIVDTGSLGQKEGFEQYYTYVTVYDEMDEPKVSHRVVLEASILYFKYLSNDMGRDYIGKSTSPQKLRYLIPKNDDPILQLPILTEEQQVDPFVGPLLIVPCYELSLPNNRSKPYPRLN